MRLPCSRRLLGCLLLLVVTASAACSGGDDEDDGNGPRVSVKVMTRNLYLGSELFKIILTATPDAVPARAAEFYDTVKASDIPARARLIADEIAAATPDLVGLQEVEMFRTQAPSNFSFAAQGAPDAPDLDMGRGFDFLGSLQAALAEKGLAYDATVNELTDAEMPAGTDPAMLFDVRMTDRDVILVRRGLQVASPVTKRFDTFLPLRIGGENGVKVNLVRGYSAIEATVEGAKFTFVDSHLEVGGPATIVQQAQAAELVRALAALPGNLIVAGDFNSNADNTGTTSYKQLTGTLKDAWSALHPTEPGFTCCTPDLKADLATRNSRIDLVLSRGHVRAESATVIGVSPELKTPSGLWPSDHAGLVVTLSLPKPAP
jgi:endonuclease/exonuclease/phosphatase family metal-dependent hydrolase